MNSLLTVVLASAGILTVAYLVYGRILSRLLNLDDVNPTPAITQRDDVDFVPIEPKFLLSQHFSAIAAAGPIVGPIMAGAAFGWAPALIWILVGSIFLGGVHDMTALVASIRHRARSIPDVVREHVSYRAYLLFLAFVWICLVYIIVAFTDITAGCFHDVLKLDQPDSTEQIGTAGTEASAKGASIEVAGAAIATSSLLYLALPIVMGLLLRYTKMSLNLATVIFVPLIGVSIWAGQYLPLDAQSWFGMNPMQTRRFWNMALLIYCFIASIVPVWFLLQPRGHLGGYFMYIALFGGAVGVVLCGKPIQYPAFIGWQSNPELLGLKGAPLPMFPILFIMIACGACSGFHSIIASGTTSKQLRRETDARVIGYGSMLLEAMVAIVSLCCVMMLSLSNPADKALLGKSPNYLYAGGLAQFLAVFHIPVKLGIMFGLMAFTTFVYDTLDVCTRLGRYILQEVFHWKSNLGRFVATAVTTAAPMVFLLNQKVDAAGQPVPAWKIFWNLFGASNQLLAALTLLGVTVWLWRTVGRSWVWFVVGLPAFWMYTTSMWALGSMMHTFGGGFLGNPVPFVASALFGLGVFLLIEAVLALSKGSSIPPAPQLQPAMA